jgi:hypothetical protein
VKDMDCGKLIILDWDDTLLPTSFLVKNNYKLEAQINENDKLKLKEVENIANMLIQMARLCGKVCIVTNADEGWVERSCQKFIPSVYKYIQDIDIISAKTKYSSVYPNKIHFWKVAAMTDCVQKLFKSPDVITDFISLGDSSTDRYAALSVGKSLPLSTVKSIKFYSSPTIEQLKKQQEFILRYFPYFCTNKNNMDMMLNIEVKA